MSQSRSIGTGRGAIAAAVVIIVSAGMAGCTGGRPEAGYGCTVTDGDTIRCGDERIRLLGIDAPEMPGHCRPGRACAAGDPYASRANLGAAIGASMSIVRIGTDRYGRTVATVSGPEGDLSCWQLTHQQADYRFDWDNGLRIARQCPAAIF